jgi:putative ABC transport system ATP-binding protein
MKIIRFCSPGYNSGYDGDGAFNTERSSIIMHIQPTSAAAPGSLDQHPGFICLDNLTKSFTEGGQTRSVLRGASLCFERGEFAAILGKSGTGKTTLLNLISGIDLAEAGTVWVNGANLTGMSDRNRTLFRRKNIGFIFQFFNLIPTLTVWENIALPLELNGMLNPEGVQRGEALLEAVGLIDRRSAFPDRLSGGEQQRVSLARALVHDPLLVLADEPTGNLDEVTGRLVMDLLDRLVRKAGKSLVLVTHSPDAAAYADRTFILRDGRLNERSVPLDDE